MGVNSTQSNNKQVNLNNSLNANLANNANDIRTP